MAVRLAGRAQGIADGADEIFADQVSCCYSALGIYEEDELHGGMVVLLDF